MDVDRKQLKNFFNKKISIARKKGDEQRRMARYCSATGGGPGLPPLPEEDGDEEIDEQVDPRLITGTGPVIDELSVVNVPGGGMFSSSHDGARVAPPLLLFEDYADVPVVVADEGEYNIDDGIIGEEVPSPPRPAGPSSRYVWAPPRQDDIRPSSFNAGRSTVADLSSASTGRSTVADLSSASTGRSTVADLSSASTGRSAVAGRSSVSTGRSSGTSQPSKQSRTQPAAASSSGDHDHAYLSQPTSLSRKKVAPKKAPSSSSSSKTSQEGEAYKDLMREKKRILRLEAMILHEAKKKEAEYWHLMKMKLVAELTGESVDLSEIDMTAGPLLNGDLSQSISNPYPDPDDRHVNIVCTFNFFFGTVKS